MDEPEINNIQQMINSINICIDLLKESKIKNKYIRVNDREINCLMRATLCESYFNNQNPNCSICWFNWFIHYKEGKVKPSDDKIKDIFKKIDNDEMKKRDSYFCYTLVFDVFDKHHTKDIIKIGRKMILELEKKEI